MTQDNDPWRKNPKQNSGGDFLGLLEDFKDSLLGKKGGGDQGGDSNHPRSSRPINKNLIMVGVGVVFMLWLSTGFYVVNEGFKGVELLFGKHSGTDDSGLRWHVPKPLGTAIQVDTGSINSFEVGSSGRGSEKNEGQMLTSDENIVEISLSVQYRVAFPEDYLFNVNEPEKVLSETTISSIREVVGGNTVDYILTDGRSEWPSQVKQSLIDTLQNFNVGIEVLRVELRDARAPKEVQDAFDDAVKAREDAEGYKLQAEAYQNKQVPLAQGEAERKIQAAEAYKAEAISKATGEAKRFVALLGSYRTAPSVTRDRMYIETLQNVYSNVSNVIVDTNGDSPLIYLPIGQGEANTQSQQNISKQALSGAYQQLKEEEVLPQKKATVTEANKEPAKGARTR